MKVLVTGAQGFLGRQLVLALRRHGHSILALDLPRGGAAARREAQDGVEEISADLCESPDLAAACEGAGAVVHLAAKMQGDPDSIVATALVGTRRLLDAMARVGAQHLVLASSLSVYDWRQVGGILQEDAPLEPCPEARDAYTIAKIRQEQLARDGCGRARIALTVMRPAVIWGKGREYPPTIGPGLGPFHVMIGAGRQLPLIHVENCADAFAMAVDAGPRAEGTYNIVDHPDLTVRRFVADHLRRSGRFGFAIPAPYRAALAGVNAVHRLTPGSLRKRLPSFVAPRRFEARYGTVQVDGGRFRDATGWRPPLGYEQCLERTYGRTVAD